MLKIFKKYLWLFEFIAAALILVLGIYVKIQENVLYLVVGVAITILGLFRIVPLFKTTDDRVLRYIYLGEMFINIGIGIALMVLFINSKTDQKELLGYLIGGVLYLRGLIYFYSTVLRKEGTDFTKFITHIVIITVGTAIIARGGFTQSTLAWLLLGISLLTSVVMIFSGFSNYNNYRHQYRAAEKSKEISTIEGLELPSDETPASEPVTDPKEDQPEERIIQ